MAKILVIDDENNIRMMIRLALQHVGHTVATAGDGAEGLEKFGDGAGWDVVLLDQRMPGLEGLEVLREMRRRAPAARVLLITAFGTIDLAAEAMRAGAADFLRKPFTVDILRAAVQAALAGPTPEADSPSGADPGSFESTGVNGFRLCSAPDIGRDPDGALRAAFTLHAPRGEARPCTVVLTPALVDRVRAHAGREDLPGGDRFWQALCGEALANHLWQHAEPPADGVLPVEDLTSGLRRWIDEALSAAGSEKNP